MAKKITIKVLCYCVTVFLLSLTQNQQTYAFEAESENYKLDWGNLNNFSGNKYSDNYSLVDTGGQFAPGSYGNSSNFEIKAGFEYLYSIIPFSFTLSNSSIDFGTLTPLNPKTDYTEITVTSGAAHGYIVTIIANHQMENLSKSGIFINDTIGDNGTITYSHNDNWTLNSTTGFGYTLEDIVGTDATFTSGYKQFPDLSNGETEQIILSNNEVTRQSISRINYKINIDSLQAAGIYQNQIKFICSGTF